MPTIKLKITATVAIHGRKPGEVFPVKTDADGIVTDFRWRRRLEEEQAIFPAPGAVAIVTDDPPPPAPASPANPA